MIYFELLIVILLGVILEFFSIKPFSLFYKRKLYLFVCLILFLVIAAFRSVDWVISMGLDAGSYSWFFVKYRSLDLAEIINIFINRQEIYMGETDIGEIGFVILNRVIGQFTNNYNVYCFFADLFFFVPFGLLIYRYTTNIRQMMFAFVFYIALIQIYMISGGRQMFALGMDIMALLCVAEKKYKRSIVFYLISISMHLSSAIFAIPLLMIGIDISIAKLKQIHLASLLLSLIVYLFPNQLLKLMVTVSGLAKYTRFFSGGVNGGANTFIILMEFLSVFCYAAISRAQLLSCEQVKKMYAILPLISLLTPLIRSNGSMIRISLYFFIYLVVLVPYGIDRIITKSSIRVGYAVILAVFAFLFIRAGVMDYHFMWQSF